jgi:ubiquinone/menaquinone biosynthesis C-methylase UbiE
VTGNPHLAQSWQMADSGAPAELNPEAARREAERYADRVAPTFVTIARRAVDLAQIEPGQSVLDVGTGTGLAAFFAAERAGRDGTVIGLDAAAAMLDVARDRSAAVGYGHIRWQQGDAAELTFADESFDAVLAVQSLMLLPRPDLALEEIRRVLVEGGRAVVTIWGAKRANEWAGLLEQALRRADPAAAPPEPFGLGQSGNLEALLQAVGLEDIEAARVPDVMRFQGPEAFWEWAQVTCRWGPAIAALDSYRRERMRAAVLSSLAPRVRGGEVAISREIVYARAVAPEAA